MATKISIVNQKGGTGKSTSCINIASGLALRKHKTLLVDLDPQANATISSGIEPAKLKNSIYDALLGHVTMTDIFEKARNGLVVAPANAELANTDISLEGKQSRLKEIFKTIEREFEYILIDCPPSLNLLTINALTTSNKVIIPVLCDYLSMEGLKQLLDTIGKIKTKFNDKLEILGILPNMVDRRRNLTNEVLELVRNKFKESVLKTEIPVCVALAEAPSYGKDIFSYASWSSGAEAYNKLVNELKSKLENV